MAPVQQSLGLLVLVYIFMLGRGFTHRNHVHSRVYPIIKTFNQRNTKMLSATGVINNCLQISSKVIAASSCINPVMSGGILSGGLHAVTGPDHLAAILPPSVGHPGWYGMRLGAIWGMGHGLSAIFLGVCAYILKGTMSTRFKFLQNISLLAESVVGISLMLIGFVGIRENLEIEAEEKVFESQDNNDIIVPQKALKSSGALFANGILHGFSWDGAPSLAPALAMTTWKGTLSFLFSYCIGTMAVMSLVAGLVGEGSVRLGKIAKNPNLPRNLSLFSSAAAVVIGIFWFLRGLGVVP